MHLRDALRYRRSGKSSDMEMGLSLDTHRKIHKHKAFHALQFLDADPAALVLGAIVSSLEPAAPARYICPLWRRLIPPVRKGAFNLLLLYNFFYRASAYCHRPGSLRGRGAKHRQMGEKQCLRY